MKKLRNSIYIIILLTFSFINTSQAQEGGKTLSLSIEDITRIALENSLDIQIAKLDAYIKRTSLGRAKSVFDTFINAEATYRNDKTKPPSIVWGTETMENTYSFGLNKKLPTGTNLSINAKHDRIDTNSQFEFLNPAHEAIVTLSLEQPIGKNFFGLADRSSVKITKIDIENADYTSTNSIEQALSKVQSLYWKFVLKCEELKIKKDMLKEAQKLYEIYREKYDLGLAEKADLLAMEANVTIRESDVLIAYLERNTAKNDLLFLLNEEDISLQLVPEDSLATTASSIDLNSALKEAIANRRDYKKMKNTLKANDIDIQVKKNALWPEIDLQASFTRNGLDTEFGKAWNDIIDENNPEFFAGITFNMPLENNMARAQLKEVRLTNKKLILSMKQIEKLILLELNNKVKEANTLKSQVELFTGLVDLQKDKLKEEKKRLKYGRSSSDILIRYEDDLLEARLQLARSFSKYRVSLIELDLAKNTLLDKYWEGEL